MDRALDGPSSAASVISVNTARLAVRRSRPRTRSTWNPMAAPVRSASVPMRTPSQRFAQRRSSAMALPFVGP